MSETQTAVVETPVVVDVQPKASEIRDGMRNRHNVAADANGVHHSQTQPRDKGKFAASNEPAPEASATNVAEEANASPVVETPAKERIEIPEGHPLRDRGRRYEDELTPDEKRGLLNSFARKSELSTAQQRIQQLEADLARARAAQDGWKEQTVNVLKDPSIAAKYAELAAWDQEVADQWLGGLQSKYETNVNTKLQEVDQTLLQQQIQQAGQRFLSESYQDITGRLDARISQHPAFGHVFADAAQAYDAVVERRTRLGDNRTPTTQELWTDYVLPRLRNGQLKSVIDAISTEKRTAAQEAERKRVADELNAKQREELEARGRRNPLGRLPAKASTGQQLPVNPQLTAADHRQRVRDRNRGFVRT
jgi:hypothetical protein